MVTLGMVNGEVLVEIEDDGRGFGPETSYGMGLTGMRERVLALGGELEVEGREGVGTRVFLRVRLGSTDRREDRITLERLSQQRLRQSWYIVFVRWDHKRENCEGR